MAALLLHQRSSFLVTNPPLRSRLCIPGIRIEFAVPIQPNAYIQDYACLSPSASTMVGRSSSHKTLFSNHPSSSPVGGIATPPDLLHRRTTQTKGRVWYALSPLFKFPYCTPSFRSERAREDVGGRNDIQKQRHRTSEDTTPPVKICRSK